MFILSQHSSKSGGFVLFIYFFSLSHSNKISMLLLLLLSRFSHV